MKQFIKHSRFALIYSIIVILLCALPGDSMPSLDFMDLFSFDKIAHMLAFGILCILTAIALAKYLHFSYMRKYVLHWTFFYCIFLGAATETGQAYLAVHRSGDWLDFIADALGVLAGLVLFLILYTRKPVRL